MPLKQVYALVKLVENDEGIWMDVTHGGRHGTMLIGSFGTPICASAFENWARHAMDKAEPVTCLHPPEALGKVNPDDPNEDVHCLWCGDIQDIAKVCDHISRIYCHCTDGLISKPMTEPAVVIAHDEARVQKAIEERLVELRESILGDPNLNNDQINYVLGIIDSYR